MALFHPRMIIVDDLFQGLANAVFRVDSETHAVQPSQAVRMFARTLRLADVSEAVDPDAHVPGGGHFGV